MKVLRNLFVLTLGLVILSSCNDDEGNANSSKVKVALKASQTVLKAGGETTAEPLSLETFQICLGEIEFDVNDDMEDMIPGGDSIYSDIELEGPFLIDLLSADVITGIDLATAHVPNAVYEEIEFDFEPYDKNEPAGMTGNTILVKGSYEGTAFTIVSDEELELELEYTNGYTLDGADSRLFIDLNLGQLKTFVAAIDFASAVAGEDGSILISKDKNKAILDQFEAAVENAFDIDEDDDEEED
ncbi:hypothetical protein KDU71_20130 [Carboxylicivirga sediminis]|uniref:DUF4382 domain-containing protein n=1 Tax=Carboxylicivirga sediminis TaxID=2006564 RepID=A0A941F6V2_9BACT|nr:hypothetical protein [Carboxylicivirga sediminis]MBR8537891.1 hypothetical protein [Carboxylicivirga sediminis]